MWYLPSAYASTVNSIVAIIGFLRIDMALAELFHPMDRSDAL